MKRTLETKPTSLEYKPIEVPTIRLTTDETRTLMSAQAAGGKVDSYHCESLVALGLMKRIPKITQKEIDGKVAAAWKRAEGAVKKQAVKEAESCIDEILRLKREGTGKLYQLTEVGAQVCRGISVRLSNQW